MSDDLMTQTEARRIANEITPNGDKDVSVQNVSGASVTFQYTDFANTHYIPDEYRIVGVGSGWFTIEPRE